MPELFTFALSVFMGFFAIMNPIANTPVFLGLTSSISSPQKKQIARTACITAFLIVVSFILAGKYIFELFGIGIPAFKITGGILIFYVGFEMLMSKKSAIHNNNTDSQSKDSSTTDSTEEKEQSGIAISPLAIPVLAGPGTIVTAMNHVTHASMAHVGIVIAVFALMIFLTYLAFSLSDVIVKKVGDNLIAVIGKLMGLILAIIGTGMVIGGIKLAFKLA